MGCIVLQQDKCQDLESASSEYIAILDRHPDEYSKEQTESITAGAYYNFPALRKSTESGLPLNPCDRVSTRKVTTGRSL